MDTTVTGVGVDRSIIRPALLVSFIFERTTSCAVKTTSLYLKVYAVSNIKISIGGNKIHLPTVFLLVG